MVSVKIVHDEDLDCLVDASETSDINWRVKIDGGQTPLFIDADDEGLYSEYLDSNQYEISVVPPNQLWEFCGDPIPFEMIGILGAENLICFKKNSKSSSIS